MISPIAGNPLCPLTRHTGSSLPTYFPAISASFVVLDDAAIFVIAMMTLAATGMTGRYLRWSHLLGGVGMVAIGALLLFAPDLLTFTA